jgi:predicted kinase
MVKSKDTIKKEIDMAVAYILVGVPGAGKSTWIKNQTWALGLTIVSTDAFVEDYARAQSKTYSEVFEDYMPTAVDLMVDQVVRAREHNHDIIWDQTSTTIKSRKKKIDMLPDYQKVAVIFRTPPLDELIKRIDSRIGKEVPAKVILDMIEKWEEPTYEEGFLQLWYAQ